MLLKYLNNFNLNVSNTNNKEHNTIIKSGRNGPVIKAIGKK